MGEAEDLGRLPGREAVDEAQDDDRLELRVEAIEALADRDPGVLPARPVGGGKLAGLSLGRVRRPVSIELLAAP